MSRADYSMRCVGAPRGAWRVSRYCSCARRVSALARAALAQAAPTRAARVTALAALTTVLAALLFSPSACAAGESAQEESAREERAAEIGTEEPAGLARGVRILAEDAGAIFSSPARWRRRGWSSFGAIVAGTLALVGTDDEIRREVRESDAPDRDSAAERIEELGRPEVGAALPLVAYGIAALAGSKEGRRSSLVAFEAWLLTAASTAALKGITARDGPADGDENDFWKGGDFFPSGHTSRTFAIAAALAERHGARAAWIAYPLATLVGLSRIETDAHWASDVAAGAALGIAIGRTVARRHPVGPGRRADPSPVPAAWSLQSLPGGLLLQRRF